MEYAELIEKLQTLPAEKQAEVFDFVEFLAARFGTADPLDQDQWGELEFAKFAMSQALRGIEDETVSYTRDDLNEHWQ